MLGFGKKGLKEGDFVFARRPDGEYNKIIFGVVTGVQGKKIGVSGVIVNPVGLRNKIALFKTFFSKKSKHELNLSIFYLIYCIGNS